MAVARRCCDDCRVAAVAAAASIASPQREGSGRSATDRRQGHHGAATADRRRQLQQRYDVNAPAVSFIQRTIGGTTASARLKPTFWLRLSWRRNWLAGSVHVPCVLTFNFTDFRPVAMFSTHQWLMDSLWLRACSLETSEFRVRLWRTMIRTLDTKFVRFPSWTILHCLKNMWLHFRR